MSDLVNHPPHYTGHPSGIEAIQVTRHMNFNLGNAMKYIWRAGLKDDAVQDLQKAMFYLADEIRRLGGTPNSMEVSTVLAFIEELRQDPERGMVADYLFCDDLIDYITNDREPLK